MQDSSGNFLEETCLPQGFRAMLPFLHLLNHSVNSEPDGLLFLQGSVELNFMLLICSARLSRHWLFSIDVSNHLKAGQCLMFGALLEIAVQCWKF